jgi:hypothetical protein
MPPEYKTMSRIMKKMTMVSLTLCVATVVGYIIHLFAADEAEEVFGISEKYCVGVTWIRTTGFSEEFLAGLQ